MDNVSIPIGFSSSLQHYIMPFMTSTFVGFNPYRVFKFVATWNIPRNEVYGRIVSIPIGFSSSLQPKKLGCDTGFVRRFQSLSGFQVRCNLSSRRTQQAA